MSLVRIARKNLWREWLAVSLRSASDFGFRIVVVLVALGGVVHAGEDGVALELTYSKAIQMALAKNFDIQIEKFNPVIARAETVSEEGRFDPRVEVEYSYEESRRDLTSLDPTLDSGSPERSGLARFARESGTEGRAGVAGVTPLGTRYDFGASVDRDTDTRSAIDQRYNTFVGGTITQPLLRGFGPDVNLAQIRIARADQAISAWALRDRIIDVVTDTALIYNDLFFQIQNLAVQIRSRDLAERTLRDNERRAEIGVMSPLDVVQAQADVAAREERVLVAERAVADNQNFLKQLVTDEIADVLRTPVRIAPPPLDRDVAVDLETDLERAFEIRPDYRQALLDLQKRNINVVFNRNQALPRLDLVGSLGLNGIETEVGESVSQLTVPSNLAGSLGAIFSLPIPNREARGQLQVSKLEVARALVGLKQAEQSIFVEADNAAGQIDTTRQRIQTTRAARVFAERTLEAAQARLASGTATTFEVLQFQRDLAEAEVAEMRALTDHQKAIAEYARTVGTTLEANYISLE